MNRNSFYKHIKIILAVSIAICIFVLPWKEYFKQDTITLEGKAYAPLLNQEFEVNYNYLFKNYTYDGRIFLEGKVQLGLDVLYFGDLKKAAIESGNDKGLKEILSMDYPLSSAELLQDGRIIGFALSNNYGLISLSNVDGIANLDSKKQGNKDYGLYMKNGELKGYSWGNKLGWMCWGDCVNKGKELIGINLNEDIYKFSKFISILYSVKILLAIVISSIGIIFSIIDYIKRPIFEVIAIIGNKKRSEKPPQ